MTPSPPPVRIGIAGLGKIALVAHLPGFDKVSDCRVTAVATPFPDRGRKITSRHGVQEIHRSWRTLVRSPQIDAVSICLPNHLHAPAALEAFRAGKHVLVEKPMALNQREAREMIRAGHRHRRVLMVHHNMRFDPALRGAAEIIHRGTLGRVFAFKCTLAHRGPEAWNPGAKWFRNLRLAGGGVLMDLGVHLFDAIPYLLSDRPVMVSAMVPGKPGGAEDHASLMVRFRGGATGTITLSWRDTHYQNRYYFFGDKGTLGINLGKGDPLSLEMHRHSGLQYPPLGPRCFKPTLYEHFIDCIRKGYAPEVSGREGSAALAVAEAAYRSLKSRRWEVV